MGHVEFAFTERAKKKGKMLLSGESDADAIFGGGSGTSTKTKSGDAIFKQPVPPTGKKEKEPKQVAGSRLFSGDNGKIAESNKTVRGCVCFFRMQRV